MLALVLSLLLTVYLIVPEAIFRAIFGWFLPTKEFVLTRTDTAYRAVGISVLPFILAMVVCWYAPGPQNWPFPVNPNTAQGRREDYKTVAAGFYSDAEFAKSPATFWGAFTRSSRRQGRMVCWYFSFVALEALLSGVLASRYAKYRRNRLYRWLADKFLFHYISKWHPLLTPYVSPDAVVLADILCTNDTLYQGYVSQYFLKDGQLSGIILKRPKRFNRPEYVKAKEAGDKPNKNDYWTKIPSQNLIFLADKIFNMNVSFVPAPADIEDSTSVGNFLVDEFSPLEKSLGKLTVSIEKEKGSSPDKDKNPTGQPRHQSDNMDSWYLGSIELKGCGMLFYVVPSL